MSSGQSNLRRLMQLQREKTTAKPKSILRSKPSHQQRTNNPSLTGVVEGEKVGKRKRSQGHQEDKDLDQTKQTKVDAEDDQEFQDFLYSVDHKDAATNQPEQDEEFQDFMDSVDDGDAVEQKDHAQVKEKASLQTTESKAEKTTSNEDVGDQQLDEVEQAAYEARLAKLMLMTRRKKNITGGGDIIENDNTAIDFGSSLVMNEMDEDDKRASSSEGKSSTNKSSLSSLKDIMKKKQKKKSNANQSSLEDDDAYWTSF